MARAVRPLRRLQAGQGLAEPRRIILEVFGFKWWAAASLDLENSGLDGLHSSNPAFSCYSLDMFFEFWPPPVCMVSLWQTPIHPSKPSCNAPFFVQSFLILQEEPPLPSGLWLH